MADLHEVISLGIGTPSSIPHFILFGLSPAPLAGADGRLSVGTGVGVDKAIMSGWSIDNAANARAVLACRIRSQDGSYRPELDEEIELTIDGTTLFVGIVEDVQEGGLSDQPVTAIVNTVRATDFNTFGDRRHINAPIPAGTLKAALEFIVSNYIGPEYGVTLDPAQVDGPLFPDVAYTWVPVSEVLNDFTARTGGTFVWEIDQDKVLRMFEPATNAAPFNITVSGREAKGDVRVEPTRKDAANYVVVNTETLSSIALDPVDIATRRIRSAVYSAKDPTTQAELDALAATILSRSLVELKRVTYRTYLPGLVPGMSQTITLPARNLSNIFLITNVRISDVQAKDPDYRIAYDVTAVEGLVYQPGWRETFRSLLGGNNQVAGGGVPIGGGGPSTPGAVRYIIDLGGSSVESVTCPTTSNWVSATRGATQKQISTVARGTTAATVTARMRALVAGVSVRARLFNVTLGTATPGTSSLVTSAIDPATGKTAYQTVTWGTTLTPGSDFYEIQLLISVAESPADGNGYIE